MTIALSPRCRQDMKAADRPRFERLKKSALADPRHARQHHESGAAFHSGFQCILEGTQLVPAPNQRTALEIKRSCLRLPDSWAGIGPAARRRSRENCRSEVLGLRAGRDLKLVMKRPPE